MTATSPSVDGSLLPSRQSSVATIATDPPPPPPPAKIESLGPRMASGSIGAIVTSLVVTPLEVVKVRQQSFLPGALSSRPAPSAAGRVEGSAIRGTGVVRCPMGCGTFVLNNGLMDCVVPKCSVPYFDNLGNPSPASPPAPSIAAAAADSSVSAGKSVAADAARKGRGGVVPGLGTFGTLRSIFRTEGLGGIYAGLGPTLVMSVPNTVIYFTLYDEITGRLRRRRRGRIPSAGDGGGEDRTGATSSSSPSTLFDEAVVPLVGGSSARGMASIVTSPLELIRTRQASYVGDHPSSRPPGMAAELRSILRTDGLPALYRGLAPTLWRDVPFSAIYWLFLERFKATLGAAGGILGGRKYRERGEALPPLLSAGHAFASGAGAGMIAAFFTTPFDVVKTRQQMVSREVAASLTASASAGAVVCNHGGAIAYDPSSAATARQRSAGGTLAQMKRIAEEEGITGLWRGNQTRMIKVAPACAVMISCYELGKRVLE